MKDKPCHFTSKNKVGQICEEGIEPTEGGLGAYGRKSTRRMAESQLQRWKPDKYPSRDEVTFLFPPRECRTERKAGVFWGEKTKLTVEPKKVPKDCECFLGNFDMFTRLTGAVQDNSESRMRNAATAYWREFEKCGNLSECVEKAKNKKFRSIFGDDNREIACKCDIPSEAIEECG